MEQKVEFITQDANIFIYDKMDPKATTQILFSKIELLKKSPIFSPMILNLQEKGGHFWLIRESRIEGLLTVQSLSYNTSSSQWQANTASRYMLSVDKGWISNRHNPKTIEFNTLVQQTGGFIKVTEENAGTELPGLLKILSNDGYYTENRINPKIDEETKTKGYSDYHVRSVGHSFKLEPTTVTLPERILMALSCPLATQKTGEAKLMKDPVTALDGVTYERTSLLEQSPSFQEKIDFYPNIKLKTIINYVAATSLKPEEYLTKLKKVEFDILDPILLSKMDSPVLSPSGHSFEKNSIEQWIKSKQSDVPTWGSTLPIPDPVTNENIRGKPFIENINLKMFIQAWPSFYEQQQSTLSSPSYTIG
ncbi:hypothetical protein TUM19329_23420 [Legionella antarctica]|uniref:U-box domain-containing protein n=1 Tax=Legionella antarctica TaxID=2708020 RepID=A0A6F8T6A1_9GAMM|nr:U-box domain-containing protein [Legionella antarctica]BCA95981.1 hypothetical protein TUM19329_23420 [Legionella antarctica]